MPPPPPSPDWAFFLDFDGTLVEIAETPDAVVVPASLLELIAALSVATDHAAAIVTGRSLETLDRLLAPIRIAAAGQHGLERRGRAGQIVTPILPARSLDTVRQAFTDFAACDTRLIVEDKGLGIALHFRRAPDAAEAATVLANLLAETCRGELELLAGKSVLEFRAGGANKGDAVRHFMTTAPFAGRRPVMIGDDVTDEDGFAVVNDHDGVSIQVGGRIGTKAKFSLPDVTSVHMWLREACAPPPN